MSKPTKERNYNVIVHDITFSKMDEEGNALTDKDGKVIIYEAPDYDVSWICDSFDSLDDEDLERELVPQKPEEPLDIVPVGTSWCAEDVRNHYGDRVDHMTDEEILDGLQSIYKRFDEALTESGWNVIDFCFDIKEGGI